MDQESKDKEDSRVWVYRYTYWDDEAGKEKTSHVLATLEAIKMGLGVPVFSSAMKVDPQDVAGGFYMPRQKGPRSEQSVSG
jgi:hypothetical protein